VSEILTQITNAVIEGSPDTIGSMTERALAQGISARDVLDNALLPGMDHVGGRFKAGDLFIPEVLLSAKAMQTSLALLKPHFQQDRSQVRGKVLLVTVQGDLHDIGKNLVAMMLEGAVFEVYDLGKDVSPAGIVAAIREKRPDILGMSALLTTTMIMMGTTILALKEAGVRDQIKIMVGGAPVTGDFARKIGADGHGPNAIDAVDLAKSFMGLH
jgi:5-methyltetrahydrofolate--homocysteine methyltransferase